MKKLKHRKYRNTGLIFEILTRTFVGEAMRKSETKSVPIMKKYFSVGTEINKELALYNELTQNSVKIKNTNGFVNAIIDSYKTSVDKVKLEEEKVKLVGAIKKSYDLDDIFSQVVPNYKTTASIYKLFEYSISDNPSEYMSCIEHITEHITETPKEETLSEVQSVWRSKDRSIRTLAFKILIEKFNKKYTGLNAPQKKLLRKFVNEDINSSQFKDFVYAEVDNIRTLLSAKYENMENAVNRIKLGEAIRLLENIVGSRIIKSEHISALLKYYELVEKL